MNLHIINQSEVRQLLPLHECIEVMAAALATLARGDAILPLRPIMWLPDKVGALAMMPAYLGDTRGAAMGLKVISVFPGNHGTPYDSHQGAVLLFDTQHGQLLAVIDASAITALRTAAVSAVATRLLARPDAHDLALLGAGTQAATHLAAMLLVRPLQRVRIWSRSPQHARQFAERETRRHGITIEPIETAQAAVAGADIICTVTAAPQPVLLGDWIAPGAHVNAVGSCVPFTRELDTAAVVKSRLFVDRRESTLNEAGDFLFPRQEGAIGDDHILGEIGELLLGQRTGRASPDEITLFKSLGLSVEDLAAAQHVYRQALAQGLGAALEFGGSRHAGA
jgi:alanine dehydrogenase